MNQLLVSFLGKRFLSASTAVYSAQDVSDEGPLEIYFHDNSFLVFELDIDGQSVSCSSQPLSFPESENNSTIWHRLPLEAPQFINSPLTKVEAYKDSGYVSAWKLCFESNFICFANNGDRSQVSINKNPESFTENWVSIK